MAPDLEPDFVLTISDNDLNFPATDDEENSTAVNLPNKKRKRNLENSRDPDSDSLKTTKKRKNRSDFEQSDGLADDQNQTWMTQGEDDGVIASDFEFEIGDVNLGVVEDFDGWGITGTDGVPKARSDKKGVEIDELIARRRTNEGKSLESLVANNSNGSKDDEANWSSGNEEAAVEEEMEDETLAEDGFGMGVPESEEESGDAKNMEAEKLDSESDHDSVAEPVPHPDDEGPGDSSDEESDGPEERARREAFFAPEEKLDSKKASKSSNSFQSMSLSRPILRGLVSVGFSEPTQIQNKTIPIALLGKDVVGGAVTGSGKTAAFIIPILERLLYRPRKLPTSRVVILMPTRELAVQCFNVAKKLASFTDITFCQMVGGFSLREQEAVLRSRPDVIIATPGRFIDHMRNSASFTVDTLEILVLDEADRMLEDGFADELNEILTTIPKSRQTMLFSATMTDKVDKLIPVGLNRPVRLMVDAKKQTVGTLIQEFVRLRPGREDKRLACLLYLCENVYTDKVIIFFRQKREAHRVRIIFGLSGLKVSELHGDMTQEQRISSIESFRASNTTHLLATDLASRGLDIRAVSTVLNYEPPQSHSIYLHRVGRTARAGLPGRACSLVSEPDRKIVREIVRAAKSQGARVVSRVLDPAHVDRCADRIEALATEVEAVLGMEKEEKALGEAERDVKRGENLVGFADEIASRPRRTWFGTEAAKQAGKERGSRELNGAENSSFGIRGKEKKVKKAEGGKMSGKERKRLDDGKLRETKGGLWKKGSGAGSAKTGAKGKRGANGKGGVKGVGKIKQGRSKKGKIGATEKRGKNAKRVK